MLIRMHKIKIENLGCLQRDRTESESYEGAQTFIWLVEDNVAEVPFDREHLSETILSPTNLNKAYKAVVRNKGCGGIDSMSCEELLSWFLANNKTLICSLMEAVSLNVASLKGRLMRGEIRLGYWIIANS